MHTWLANETEIDLLVTMVTPQAATFLCDSANSLRQKDAEHNSIPFWLIIIKMTEYVVMTKYIKKVPHKLPPINLPVRGSYFYIRFCTKAEMSSYSTDISLVRCKCGIKHECRAGSHISFNHIEIEQLELMHFIHAAVE